jgi:hypothetical protein
MVTYMLPRVNRSSFGLAVANDNTEFQADERSARNQVDAPQKHGGWRMAEGPQKHGGWRMADGGWPVRRFG